MIYSSCRYVRSYVYNTDRRTGVRGRGLVWMLVWNPVLFRPTVRCLVALHYIRHCLHTRCSVYQQLGSWYYCYIILLNTRIDILQFRIWSYKTERHFVRFAYLTDYDENWWEDSLNPWLKFLRVLSIKVQISISFL